MTESEFAADTEAPPPTEAVSSALPWGKVIPIYIAIWCEAFNSSSIFAYVGYMILDFGLSKDKNDPAFMCVALILPPKHRRDFIRIWTFNPIESSSIHRERRLYIRFY